MVYTTAPAAHALRYDDRPVVIDPERRDVAIVGLGYVGLPTAMAVREAGMSVVGVDVSDLRVQAIKDLRVDLPRDELARLRRVVDEPGLTLGTDPSVLSDADAVIVCVPTPVDEHLVPDLRALRSAVEVVVAHARRGQVIVLTSTTYVGCTRELLVEPLRRRGLDAGTDVHIAFAPERIDPGVAHHRVDATPRVVGGLTPECARRAAEVLEPTCPSVHLVATPEIAEMTKLLENTFRAVNIALANEMADVADTLGVPINDVIDAAATKPYGFMAFRPGPGVGGHCIPCDPHYLLWQLRRERVSAPVVDAAMGQISLRPGRVTVRSRELLADRGVPLRGARVHLVGAAYKPGVADVRESPALEVLESLRDEGADVTYEDPMVPSLQAHGVTHRSVRYEHLDTRPDLVIVLTNHPTQELSWLSEVEVVLDATYQLAGAAQL